MTPDTAFARQVKVNCIAGFYDIIDEISADENFEGGFYLFSKEVLKVFSLDDDVNEMGYIVRVDLVYDCLEFVDGKLVFEAFSNKEEAINFYSTFKQDEMIEELYETNRRSKTEYY